jgi:hypothetical protein
MDARRGTLSHGKRKDINHEESNCIVVGRGFGRVPEEFGHWDHHVHTGHERDQHADGAGLDQRARKALSRRWNGLKARIGLAFAPALFALIPLQAARYCRPSHEANGGY